MDTNKTNLSISSKPMPQLNRKDISSTMIKILRRLRYGQWSSRKDLWANWQTLNALYAKGFIEKGELDVKTQFDPEKHVLYRLTKEGDKFITKYDKVPLKEQGYMFTADLIKSIIN